MTLTRQWLTVAASYVAALAAAALSLALLPDEPVLVQVFIADVIATTVVFAFSVAFSNSSFYDPYWSVAPIVIAGYFLWLGNIDWRAVLLCTVVLLWGIRLTANWLYGWQGLDHEDWRYVDLKAKSGVLWWPLSFAGIHLFPTVIVFLGCIAMYPALVTGNQPLNVIDGVALAVGLLSVWIEFEADRQLHRFRSTRQSREEVLTTGVWALCRHPNYLGEIGFWVSVYLFGYAALGGSDPWMNSGPVAMVLLFMVVSIPMIDNKLAADKPGFARYKASTFALLPVSFLKR